MDEKEKEELLKEIEKKIEDYTKKIEKNPNNASYYYNRGNAYRNRGNTFKNLERLQEAVEDFKKAIESYDKAIELNPNNASYYNNRGITFNNLKKYNEAISDFNRAIDLNPNSAFYYNNRGNTYFNLKKYNKAIEDYSKAIDLNPDNASYYNNRGNAYFNLKEFEKAINDCNRAINLNPKKSLYFYNRGISYKNLKQYEKAINDYNKAIDLNPDYVSAYNNRGTAYFNLGEFEKAIEEYDKAIELDPNNSYAIKFKKIVLELKENKNIQEDNKIIDIVKNNKILKETNEENKSTQQDNKIVDTTKNKKKLEKTNKEDNLEPDFIFDFNEVKALYLNGIFKENKKKLNLFIKKYKKDSKKERQIENLLKEVESIREFLENHQKASNGYLTFADILGWKGIWKKQNSDNEKVDTLNTLLFIKNKLEEEFKEQRKDKNNDDYKINLISDTYVIYSKELELSNKLSKRLLELCLINGLLIRGATSYGKFYNNDMVYIGQAVDEAASWHEKGEEVGIFYTSSARLSKNLSDNELEKYLLINDEVNTKIGKIKTYFINWYNDITERNFYSIMKNEVINPEYSLKYFNTENRLKKILHSEEGEKNNVKNR